MSVESQPQKSITFLQRDERLKQIREGTFGYHEFVLDAKLHFDLGLHAEEGTAPCFGFPIFDFSHDEDSHRCNQKRPYKGVDNALQFSRVKRSIDYVMNQFAYGRRLVRVSKKP